LNDIDFLKALVRSGDSRIILIVIDGLGGLPLKNGGKTGLESANRKNLDTLAKKSVLGLIDPVGYGITPGSGPAHLALFGYDPLKYIISRGALEAAGIDFPLEKNDVAARINFATIDKNGIVLDRRAGRITTEKNKELCKKLSGIKLSGIEIFIRPVKEHRAVVVFRRNGLSGKVTDSDPQVTGKRFLEVKSLESTPEASGTAGIANEFIKEALSRLRDSHPANALLMRGFASPPSLPGLGEAYGLKSAAIATYPMYKGLARLCGMEILKTGATIAEEFNTLEKEFKNYDFFYIHIKGTDSAGEDGDFKRKVKVIEEVDKQISRLFRLKPVTLAVTGDHSTPALLKSHSWHPVPILLYSPYCRPDKSRQFTETECVGGGLGRFPAVKVISLLLAHSLRLNKFGA
jgi:2,3-bisphosphoglycerate-independent phosphoglycerate mutase